MLNVALKRTDRKIYSISFNKHELQKNHPFESLCSKVRKLAMQSVVQCTPYIHLDSQIPAKFFQVCISSQIQKHNNNKLKNFSRTVSDLVTLKYFPGPWKCGC